MTRIRAKLSPSAPVMYSIAERSRSTGQTIEFDCESYEEVDLKSYVQVTFPNCGIRYTYIDPSGGRDLKLGNWVLVGTRYGDSVAKVVGFGRGSWTGPCKTVKSVFEEFPLEDWPTA